MKKSLVSNWLKSYLYFTEPIGNIIPFAPSTEKNIFIHDNVEILGEMLRKTSLAEENRISLVDLSDNPGGATASEKEEQVNNGTDSVFNYLVFSWWREYKSLISMLYFQTAVSLFSILIIRYSLIGILLKITANHTKESLLALPAIPSKISTEIKKKLFVQVSDHSESENSDDEIFVECSSTMLPSVAREESVPKANQDEEKYMKTIKSDISEEDVTDIPCSERNHDPVCVSIALDNEVPFVQDLDESFGFTTSTPRDSVIAPIGVMDSLNEISPEKFRRYLHEKNQEIERLGISFDEDGYIKEDLDASTSVPAKSDAVSKLDFTMSSLRQSIWHRISFVF